MSAKGKPQAAIVLAAGLGKRMRPITERMPKPLIPIAGKPLLDWGLDALATAGIERAVINVHHLGDQIIAHVKERAQPTIAISDETAQLLDSAGAIVKALPLLGTGPFYILNADTFWIDDNGSNIDRLALAWDDARMDILLMLVDTAHATGHSGGTDFLIGQDGRLVRSGGATEGFVYAGAAIAHPRLFAGAPAVPHSLNRYFDTAAAEGRLFGMKMRGHWITVGTPDAIAPAEATVARRAAS